MTTADDKPFGSMSEMVSQATAQTRAAMESYIDMLQKGMSALPWNKIDLENESEFAKKVKSYIEQNTAAAFEYAKKLNQAKDVEDFMKLQTEFIQTQIKTLADQAKDIGEAITNASVDMMKRPSSPPS